MPDSDIDIGDNFRVFSDDGRKIGVEDISGGTRLLVYDVSDIFPALHCIEAHPEYRKGKIEVCRTRARIRSVNGQKPEEFVPDLVEDKAGNTYGYKNYNFILLNSSMQHSFQEVVEGFAGFMSNMNYNRKLKVKIKDVEPEGFSSLLRTAKMKSVYGRGVCCYKVCGESQNPAAVYLFAERFSRGLKDRAGLKGRFPESNLKDRIYI